MLRCCNARTLVLAVCKLICICANLGVPSGRQKLILYLLLSGLGASNSLWIVYSAFASVIAAMMGAATVMRHSRRRAPHCAAH